MAASAPPVAQALDLDQALAECTRCHGEDGLGRSPATPVLAGQSEAYLRESLVAYADGRRHSGVMSMPAAAVDPDLFAALARHFSALPAPAPADPSDAALSAAGEKIAKDGIPARDVPACLGCHGRPDRNPIYPELSGQPAEYIATQLQLFRAEKRGGTRYEHLMRNAAKNLSDEDIAALAAFFAQMPRAAATGTPPPR